MTATQEMTIGDALEMLGRETIVRDPWVGRLPAHHGYVNREVCLPNGWSIMACYGTSQGCSNWGPYDPALDLLLSLDCMIAILWPDNRYMGCEVSPFKTTWDNVPAPVLLAVVDAVATNREGGPCPCPDCVRARMNERPSHDGR